MLDIVEKVFGELAFDYLLNEEEAESVIDEFKSSDVPDFLRDMYTENNRKAFARNKFEPMIKNIARNRKVIHLPCDEQLIQKAGQVIEDLAAAT